jgi:hypothetical protein
MSTHAFTPLRSQDPGEVSVRFLRVPPRINAEKPPETPLALPKGYGHGHPALEVLEVSPQISDISAHYKIGVLTIYYYCNVINCTISDSLPSSFPDKNPLICGETSKTSERSERVPVDARTSGMTGDVTL